MRGVLQITPKLSMFDKPVRILAEGLKNGQSVSITSRISHQNEIYEGEAQYKADENGIVDCNKHPALGGSFKGRRDQFGYCL